MPVKQRQAFKGMLDKMLRNLESVIDSLASAIYSLLSHH